MGVRFPPSPISSYLLKPHQRRLATSTTLRVNLDPLFRDPNGLDNDPNTHEDNNYRLSLGSPCIDTGANPDWMTDAVDLDGNRRILNETVDMGAYEFTVQGVAGDLDADADMDFVDFAMFAAHRLETGRSACGGADLTGDENVTIYDLLILCDCWLRQSP